ncbi:MAG TPA: 16S rRNA (adenine(1518)-N(6)/adenine(1519)-N(6))-dimethyltransferase RsmA [Bryobacteraceae bacterium]
MGRRLGQHFLTRKSILDRIASSAVPENQPDNNACVIEIGAGRGALTEALMERAAKVTAIEVDPVLVHYLQQKFRDAVESGRLELVEGDVLKTEFPETGAPITIAGNLPYYITSPILERVFALGTRWARAVFLVQAEVAARLAASPGGREYGYLSVLTQIHARAEILFDVPRTAFRPAPKVDSAVVLLEPRDAAGEWNLPDKRAFLRFASACFQHKRKTLRNNLAPSYGKERMDALAEGRLRAEQLSVPQLAALYRQLEAA